MIDFETAYKQPFYSSHIWKKCHNLLILFYQHKEKVKKVDMYISNYILYSFPPKDLAIIKNDFKTINDKIKKGLAHELSEGDTMYLGACTKSKNSDKRRIQPFSDIPAKPRAYCFKQSYMKFILENYVFGDLDVENIIKYFPNKSKLSTAKNESIITDDVSLESITFDEYIINHFKPYLGISKTKLLNSLGVDDGAKNTNYLICNKILKLHGNVSDSDEFKKANLTLKTISLNENGKSNESISFPFFEFTELIKEKKFEDSLFYMQSISRFLFVVFKLKDGEHFLFDVFFWNMSNQELADIKKVWKKTIDTIKNNVEISYNQKTNIFTNNLPKSTENPVAHIRPHSGLRYYKSDNWCIGEKRNGFILPNGDWMTKQSLWLNKSFINNIIESKKYKL